MKKVLGMVGAGGLLWMLSFFALTAFAAPVHQYARFAPYHGHYHGYSSQHYHSRNNPSAMHGFFVCYQYKKIKRILTHHNRYFKVWRYYGCRMQKSRCRLNAKKQGRFGWYQHHFHAQQALWRCRHL